MIDLKLLREEPDRVRSAVGRKKFGCDIDAILELDARRRSAIAEAERLRAGQKSANQEMAALRKGSPEFVKKVGEMKALAARVKELQARQGELEESWRRALLTIPNLPDASVPDGDTEEDNLVHASWGDPNRVSGEARPHWDLPWFRELVNLDRGTRIAGAGFPVFAGEMARLIRSLVDFFLAENTAAGYTELQPPLLVNADSATATGQLPDKEGQMYHVAGDGLYLIPTAEVPVTNFYRDEILEADALPYKVCAYSPCFRREAGSHGKDVRGLNRVHQFDKVELVKWVHPEHSDAELESLREDAERLLRKLELPYRTLLMCAGDIGFPHAKQYDIEVWAAGQQRWLEVSSCSNFTDFQARRANTRFRDATGTLRPVHTLNGSALAVPRVLAALLENNARADGTVALPPVLRDRMGIETIGKLRS